VKRSEDEGRKIKKMRKEGSKKERKHVRAR
jgi:hypothetical protein